MPKTEASGQHATSYRQFETLLSSDLCQSHIDGQNGSSSCTIICALFVQKFKSAEVFLDNGKELKAAMCFAMQEGNRLYEKQCLSRLLSMDEVVSLYPELEVSVLGESFVNFSCWQQLVDVLHSQPLQAARAAGGVFVISSCLFPILRTATAVNINI